MAEQSNMRGWCEIGAWAAAIGATFLLVNFVHFQFFPVSVILYACIFDMVIATSIVWAAHAFYFKRFATISARERVLTVAAANLLVMVYAIMGPTVIDRSLSIYIVEKLDQRGGAIAKDKMKDVFIQEYLPEFRLVDVRLTEQFASGTAILDGDCVRITGKGRALAAFAKFYRKNFLPKKRVLLGETTSALTDPFAHSPQVVDVSCKPSVH